MSKEHFESLLTQEALSEIFTRDVADRFFEALLGDPSEGAYDITLGYRGQQGGRLIFELELRQRPGKCLACHLTYGLPQVFSRHPVINMKGVVEKICSLIGDGVRCEGWSLGATREVRRDLHVIPLAISIAPKDA